MGERGSRKKEQLSSCKLRTMIIEERSKARKQSRRKHTIIRAQMLGLVLQRFCSPFFHGYKRIERVLPWYTVLCRTMNLFRVRILSFASRTKFTAVTSSENYKLACNVRPCLFMLG